MPAKQTIAKPPMNPTMRIEYRVIEGEKVLHQLHRGGNRMEWRPVETMDEGKKVKAKTTAKSKKKATAEQKTAKSDA
jgi:hypothetical protein